MHIILGILGAIVTILVLANRLSDAGIDLTWLNPFAWHRRRTWRKKYEGNPIFSLYEPIEVAALLATVTAKLDGDLSKEEKSALIALFQAEFGKSEREASDLLMSSVYLMGNGDEALKKPDRVIAASLEKYTIEQVESTLKLIDAVIQISDLNAQEKQTYRNEVAKIFSKKFNKDSKW